MAALQDASVGTAVESTYGTPVTVNGGTSSRTNRSTTRKPLNRAPGFGLGRRLPVPVAASSRKRRRRATDLS